MRGRRAFLAGLLSTGVIPSVGWADAGGPAFLAAGRLPDGNYVLCGLDDTGALVFQLPLPARGHAAAAHPSAPLAVAFARRPGTFARVIDCSSGRAHADLYTPAGHHFSGHGVFSSDGRHLFTTENDYEAGRGMVGVWDVDAGFLRVAAFDSGGVGPHDIRLMPDGRTLVVANGGIETHPDTGRAKLNLPSMRPNLSYLGLDGGLREQVEPPAQWHRNSMRHLAIGADGLVAIACQWQGDLSDTPPLLATHRAGEPLRFHAAGDGLERDMQGYVGSIAIAPDARIAVTGPRGGMALLFGPDGALLDRLEAPDVCGVAMSGDGFCFTTGQGLFQAGGQTRRHGVQWDNHLIAI